MFATGCNNDNEIVNVPNDGVNTTDYGSNTTEILHDFDSAEKEIKKNNPAGLLKLWKISTESTSAEYSEIASEEIVGYIYSKPKLWIKAFAAIDFSKIKEWGGFISIDTYRFTPDGELPIAVVAKKVISDLKKIKGKNKQEQVLIDYLLVQYENALKNDVPE
jgi:hypothetical protein